MTRLIRCNHCDARLKWPHSTPDGKKIRCPNCREVVTAEAETAMQTSPPRQAKFKRSRQDDDTMESDDFADESWSGDIPRSSRRRRIPIWAIALIAGGSVVLVLGVVAIIYFAASRPQAMILGSWTATDPVPGVVVEFHREGTMIVRQNGVQASARYRFLDDKLLELELQNQDRQLVGMLPRLGRFNPGFPGRFNQAAPETVKVPVTILKLTRTELDIRINDVVQRFKRGE
jgi:phage FluMu protein Com